MRKGWVVRAPASSANIGAAFDAVAVALALPLEVSDDGDEPAPETHPAVRAFRGAGGDGPVDRAVADPRRPRSRVLGRGTRRGAASPRTCNRAAAARTPGAGCCPKRPSSKATPTTWPRRCWAGWSRSPAGMRCGSRSGASSPSSCGFPTGRPRPRARGGRLPEQVPFADAVFNVGRASLLVAALAAGDTDALRIATQDRLHQDRRLAAARRRASRSRPRSRPARTARGCPVRDRRPPRSSTRPRATEVAAALPAEGRAIVLEIADEGVSVMSRSP